MSAPEYDACHVMAPGETLHAQHEEYPLFHALIYGDPTRCAKLSKRLACALRSLPLRLEFHYEHDTLAALEAGIGADPTLVLDGAIFLEGLPSAEEIAERFGQLLIARNSKN